MQHKKITTIEQNKLVFEKLQSVEKAIDELGNKIKTLKEQKAEKTLLDPLISSLKDAKTKRESLTVEYSDTDPSKLHVVRSEFEDLMTRRFFYIPSFEIYGGVGGLYDYGPSCCAIKSNLLALWRNHFVLEENMLELDCVNLTPEVVFKTSGHVAKFADFMVKDPKTGECFRADKLIAEYIDERMKDPAIKSQEKDSLKSISLEVDGYGEKALSQCIKDLKILSKNGNELSEPYPFNLMFSTEIGPTGKFVGYLRPETAQGIFVNFKRLLNYNGGNMPFAGATIGQAFRNEIAPRSGLLRVREFTLAEIEHFCHPDHKNHPKYKNVKDIVLTLFPQKQQEEKLGTIEMSIDEALNKGVLNNQTHAYFLGRVFLFMKSAGLLPAGIRFRQHLKTEMAHYAKDCWDCELLTSYGWVECVGVADRSCFDLEQHAKGSKSDLTAFEMYPEPKSVEVVEFSEKKGVLGKTFTSNAKAILEYLKSLSESDAIEFQTELDAKGLKSITVNGASFSITKDMVEWKKVTKKESGRNYTPAVIEPSFGIGRIIYAILEHSYWVRDSKEEKKEKGEDKKLERNVLSLSPIIAPFKVCVLPLSSDERFDDFIATISSDLSRSGVSYRKDDSGAAIGRRYARCDEIGIPFAITVDFDSLKFGTVTLRERDTCFQIRADAKEIVRVIYDMVEKRTTWDDVLKNYPTQQQSASEKVGKKD